MPHESVFVDQARYLQMPMNVSSFGGDYLERQYVHINDKVCAHTLPFMCTYLPMAVLQTVHISISSLRDEVYLLLPMKYIFSGQVSISSLKNMFLSLWLSGCWQQSSKWHVLWFFRHLEWWWRHFVTQHIKDRCDWYPDLFPDFFLVRYKSVTSGFPNGNLTKDERRTNEGVTEN